MLSYSQKINYPKKLHELGIELTPPIEPKDNYASAVRTGNLLYVAGHGPIKTDGTYVTGKVGKDLSLDQGIEAARLAAISLISTLQHKLGDLNKVKRIIQVNAWVNSHSDFIDQPIVVDECSDLLLAVFGERGQHARTVIGTNVLGYNIAITIEMVVEIESNKNQTIEVPWSKYF